MDHEEKIKTFLKIVNESRLSSGDGPISWPIGSKFVLAKKGNVEEAVKLFDQNNKMRQWEQLTELNPFEEAICREVLSEKILCLKNQVAFTVGQSCFSSFQSTVIVVTARLHFPKETTHRGVLGSLLYQLDLLTNDESVQIHGISLLFDMTFTKLYNHDLSLTMKTFRILSKTYPCRLKTIVIVNAPLWFKSTVQVLSMMAEDKLRKRIYFISHDVESNRPFHEQQISQFFTRDQIPLYLGGQRGVSDHLEWIKHCFISHPDSKTIDYHPLLAKLQLEEYELNERRLSSAESTPHSPNDTYRPIVTLPRVNSPPHGATLQLPTNLTASNSASAAIEDDSPQSRRRTPGLLNIKQLSLCLGEHQSIGGNGRLDDDDSAKEDDDDDDDAFLHIDRAGDSGSDGTSFTAQQLFDHVMSVGSYGLVNEYYAIRQMVDFERLLSTQEQRHFLGLYAGAPLRPSYDVAEQQAPRNRYADVLARDGSRVLLAGGVDARNAAGYINANWVHAPARLVLASPAPDMPPPTTFICAQGPLDHTIHDFWRMVLETGARIVVMVTGLQEGRRQKCARYWPENRSEKMRVPGAGGPIDLETLDVDMMPDWTVSKVNVSGCGENNRVVTHLRFTSWFDHGVPDPTAFVDFVDNLMALHREQQQYHLQSEQQPHGSPVVVHCSAGIGRTGTLVAVYFCLSDLMRHGRTCVRRMVAWVRAQRSHSVQTPEQYVFCHIAVLHWLMGLSTTSPGEGNEYADDDGVARHKVIAVKSERRRDELSINRMGRSMSASISELMSQLS